MSLVLRHDIPEAHSKGICAVAFNVHRRELYVAGEDGHINVWEMETHKLVNVFSEHTGWVTAVVYCKDYKVLISCSLDGNINVWNSSGKILQKIQKGMPIYGLSYDPRRQQILIVCNKVAHLHHLKTPEEVGLSTTSHGSTNINDVILRKYIGAKGHNDIISCVSSYDGRFVTAGYDKRIVIYEQAHSADTTLAVSHTIKNAHDAAITSLTTGKDADNTWLITGSYDCVVKLWSMDGILLRRFEGFSTYVSSICYVIPTQTLWISANSPEPITFDPRSGVNISDFVESPESTPGMKTNASDKQANNNGNFNSFGSDLVARGNMNNYKQFVYIADSNEVIGVTHRRRIKIWRYETNAALAVLKGSHIALECVAFTLKEPILIFTCGEDGVIRKWERLQLNSFMYSQEAIHLNLQILEWHKARQRPPPENTDKIKKKPKKVPKNKMDEYIQKLRQFKSAASSGGENSQDHSLTLTRQIELLSSETQKAFKRSLTLMTSNTNNLQIGKVNDETGGDEMDDKKRHAISQVYYYEELDYLICASHDGNIYTMAYDKKVFESLVEASRSIINLEDNSGESRNDRVAGLSLHHVMREHKESVTCCICVADEGSHWMVSSGWDRRLCIWNLSSGELHDVFNDYKAPQGQWEIAADSVVTDMAYSPENREFAYSSSDKMVYIRKFSTKGEEMKLKAVLQGHTADVMHVKWHSTQRAWVTASDDRTIRLWHENGLSCLRVFNNQAPITALMIDDANNCIVTGSTDHNIRIFDIDRKDIFAVIMYKGHTHEVRSIMHIPSRKQYISVSWDGTVRIWNAFNRHEKAGTTITMIDVSSDNRAKQIQSTTVVESIDEQKTMKDVKQIVYDKDLEETVKSIENSLLI